MQFLPTSFCCLTHHPRPGPVGACRAVNGLAGLVIAVFIFIILGLLLLFSIPYNRLFCHGDLRCRRAKARDARPRNDRTRRVVAVPLVAWIGRCQWTDRYLWRLANPVVLAYSVSLTSSTTGDLPAYKICQAAWACMANDLALRPLPPVPACTYPLQFAPR